jgi:hypothetical protein
VRVTQSFPFCVVLCLPLISSVLNEVRITQSFAFCVVLCLPLISPVLNEVRVSQYQGKTQHHTERKRLSTHTSFRTGDIRGKHNTTQCLPMISPVLNEVCVTQSFAFCVVLCLPLVSPFLYEPGISEVNTTPHRKQTIE